MSETTSKERTDAPSPDALPQVVHLTPDERAAIGRTARNEVPRASHATLELVTGRDPLALLTADCVGRVPELVPIRFGRMLTSPFAFYRGSATVMAHDLAPTPRTSLNVQLCGDAHCANFGGFASPERSFVFDLNDFDETHRGPFEWDVKRLAASFELAGRDRGLTAAQTKAAVLMSVQSYREAMAQFAASANLAVWYSRLDLGDVEARLRAGHNAKQARAISKATEKARTKDSLKALAKLTRTVDGVPRIISDPPLLVPASELSGDQPAAEVEAQIRELFRRYRHTLQGDRRHLLETYEYVDMARKVVGVGSVGTRCWILLMLGRDQSDPLFLQIKEARASVLEPLLGASPFATAGQRVVEGQRLMQSASDIFLGWLHTDRGIDGNERDFYVRQLWDWKTSVDLETILPEGLVLYAQTCGWTLARAHACSGDRIAISSYLGKKDEFDRAIAEFASAYADVAEADFALLRTAVDEARIEAQEGV